MFPGEASSTLAKMGKEALAVTTDRRCESALAVESPFRFLTVDLCVVVRLRIGRQLPADLLGSLIIGIDRTDSGLRRDSIRKR